VRARVCFFSARCDNKTEIAIKFRAMLAIHVTRAIDISLLMQTLSLYNSIQRAATRLFAARSPVAYLCDNDDPRGSALENDDEQIF